MHPEPSQSIPLYALLIRMCIGNWVLAAISVAARLGIADQLESGPKTTSELAEQLNVHDRLLRAWPAWAFSRKDTAERFLKRRSPLHCAPTPGLASAMQR